MRENERKELDRQARKNYKNACRQGMVSVKSLGCAKKRPRKETVIPETVE